MSSLTKEEWLAIGVASGFCSPSYCQIHDPIPFTESEQKAFDVCLDLCEVVVRIGTPEEWEETAKKLLEATE